MFHTTTAAKQTRARTIMAELAMSATISNCERENSFCPNCQTGSLTCRLNQSTGNCEQIEKDTAWFNFQNSNIY
jgi:hypothetical protein